jgi:uncharacterized membrane protein YbaN (DUF454 family)
MTPAGALRGKIATLALRAAGALFFAVGAVGIVVPLLPTVVFWILAVWCWSVSAPEWSERLLSHPRFGPPIRDFVEHGLMRRRAKVLAIGTIAASYSASIWVLEAGVAVAVTLAAPIVLVAWYLATRPERKAPRPDPPDSVLH